VISIAHESWQYQFDSFRLLLVRAGAAPQEEVCTKQPVLQWVSVLRVSVLRVSVLRVSVLRVSVLRVSVFLSCHAAVSSLHLQ
jgi:hypothetical protein